MFQVRFHGRGGHGVVTAAELLAAAAFSEGRHAQTSPSLGSERIGTPIVSFCRIDDKPIRTREPVSEPDALIIQDPTLLYQADLLAGLGHDGYLLINSTDGFTELGLDEFVKPFRRDRLLVVPASSLAQTHLGRPLPGAALLGAFAALTWVVSLDSVLAAINERFTGPVAAGHEEAARAAFNFVRDEREALTHAFKQIEGSHAAHIPPCRRVSVQAYVTPSTSKAGCLGAMARSWSSLESGPVPSKKIPTSAFHLLR
jgi:pyruvate ferredoxin oxidoreductase gamma subunit